MANPPDDMKQLWVRDEDGTFLDLVKQYARRDRRKLADFARIVLENGLAQLPPLQLEDSGEKNIQLGR